jgi:hypothetical protein
MHRVLALFVLLSIASCFTDLDEALTCPPAPKVEVSDCDPALMKVMSTGCFPSDTVACLRGPVGSYDCDDFTNDVDDECPAVEPSCNPSPDCPPLVYEEGHPAAKCIRLTTSELGGGVPGAQQCLCGNAGCASVCDGYGPVMAQFVDDGMPKPMLVDLNDQMPDSGRVGYYIRLRGLATLGMASLIGDTTTDPDLEDNLVAPTYPVLNIEGEFKEFVRYGDDAYRWANAAGKPTLLIIIPSADMNGNALALFEIDCIIPFVTPYEQLTPL